jgi:hypothetical protein
VILTILSVVTRGAFEYTLSYFDYIVSSNERRIRVHPEVTLTILLVATTI